MAGKFELGVLFVHGIGHQARGSTLDSFTAPIHEWMSARFDTLPVSGGVTRSAIEATDRNAAELRITQGEQSRRIVCTEAWWAQAFDEPSYRELIRWFFMALPLTLHRHAVRPFLMPAPKPRGIQAWLKPGGLWADLIYGIFWRRFVRPLLFILLSIVVQILFVAVGALAWLPLVGRLLRWTRVQIVRTLGDCYILVRSPSEFTKMVNTVQDGIEWLSHNSQQVIVVAHSQGAAVSHEALKLTAPTNVTLFITLGAGIDKLLYLRSLDLYRRGQLAAIAVLIVALALWIVGAILPDSHPILGNIFAGSFLAALLYLALWSMRGMQRSQGVLTEQLALSTLGRPLQWIDLYAVADPVPSGPLVTSADAATTLTTWRQHVHTTEITNRNSLFRDHTSYLSNDEQVISTIAVQICSRAGVPPALIQANWLDAPRERSWWNARSLRVSCLQRLSLAAILGFWLLALNVSSALHQFFWPATASMITWYLIGYLGWSRWDRHARTRYLSGLATPDIQGAIAFSTYLSLPSLSVAAIDLFPVVDFVGIGIGLATLLIVLWPIGCSAWAARKELRDLSSATPR